jgi:hypothetical protein
MRLRTTLAAAILTGASAIALAQSASAPLMVTATVVSTCAVAFPHKAEPSALSTVPVAVTCARRGAAARVQRPAAPRRSDMRDAVLTINF